MILQPTSSGVSFELEPANEFHLIELVYNPVTDQVDVLADGVVKMADYAGRTLALDIDSLTFGSGSSASQGISRWNLVQFITTPDTDNDGVSDVDEVGVHLTDPYNPDTDGDGLGDGFELQYGFDPLTGGEETLDGDVDGLNSLGEFEAGSDPTDADSDNDGINDGDEVNQYGSDPLSSDTDEDGIGDGDEINISNTDPADSDTDGDGVGDGDEINLHGTDPNDADSDDDGLSDGQELLSFNTDPLDNDTDNDLLTDQFEVAYNFDPLVGGEQTLDGDEDGLDNLGEQSQGSDPENPDTDGDGLPDGDEVSVHGTSPILLDTDGDGLSDSFELAFAGFDPLTQGEEGLDTDGDGLTSLDEQANNTDPNNADSDSDGFSDGDEVRILGSDANNPNNNGVPIVRDTILDFWIQDGRLHTDSAEWVNTVQVMNENYGGQNGQIYRLDQQIPLETVQQWWDEGYAECRKTRTGSTTAYCSDWSVTPSDSVCRNGGDVNFGGMQITCCINIVGAPATSLTYPTCGTFGTDTFSINELNADYNAGIPTSVNIPQGLGDRPTVAPPPVELDVGAEVTHSVGVSAAVNTTVAFNNGGEVDLDYEVEVSTRTDRSTVPAGETFRIVPKFTVIPEQTSMTTVWPSAELNVSLDMDVGINVSGRYASIKPNPSDPDDLQLDTTFTFYDQNHNFDASLFDLQLGAWSGFKMTIFDDQEWVPELYRDLEIQFDPPGPGLGFTYEFEIPPACPDAPTFTPCNLLLKPPLAIDLMAFRLQLPDMNTPVPQDFNGGADRLFGFNPAPIHRNYIDNSGALINTSPGRYRPSLNFSPEKSVFDTFVGDGTTLDGDWMRIEADLDGLVTLGTGGVFISGINVQDPLGVLKLEMNLLDSDLVYWAGNDQSLTFNPNLKADLVFSKTVSLIDGNGVNHVVNAGQTFTIPVNANTELESAIEVVQPEGGVDVDVSYSFRDNCFENVTYELGTFGWRNAVLQLKLQGFIGAALGAAALPTDFQAFQSVLQFGEPIQSENKGGNHMLGGMDEIVIGGGNVLLGTTACSATPDIQTAQLDFAGPSFSVMDLTGDADADGISDLLEDTFCASSLDADTDDDGLFDGLEDVNGNGIVDPGETSPCIADSDGDGLTDGQERGLTSAVPDPDGNGPLLGTDIGNFAASTVPTILTSATNADTDGDGLTDGEEINVKNTNPQSADTDGDGVLDGVDDLPLDPTEDRDTDRDGIGNNLDTDDDNDLVLDIDDAFPLGFSDVKAGFWAFDFIEKLAINGITSGCGGAAEFCPNDSVTRAQMAVFLERGIRGANYSPPAPSGNVFVDVGVNDFAAGFIEQLAADGITSGCGNMQYCPQDPVTRAQMAVFLLRSKYGSAYTPPAPAAFDFGDVDASHWAASWIYQLRAEGITSGCGNGDYCPDDEVTRAQLAVFLVRTFDL